VFGRSIEAQARSPAPMQFVANTVRCTGSVGNWLTVFNDTRPSAPPPTNQPESVMIASRSLHLSADQGPNVLSTDPASPFEFDQDPTIDARHQLASFAAFSDCLAVPVFILDVEDDGIFRFRKHNLAHERRTGLGTSRCAGKTLHEVLPPRTADTIQNNLRTCVDRRDTHQYEELLVLGSEEQWWHTTLSPVLQDDRVIGIVGIAHDITDWKTREKAFADALQELNRTHTDLEVLTSATAHDLRGPLRQARLIYDLIVDGFEDLGDRKLELIETGGQIVDRALHQIDEVLTQTRQGPKSNSRFHQVDFGHLCSDLIAVLDPLKTLHFEHDDGMVHCEKFILDVALRNLVDNAVKHAKRQVGVYVREKDGRLIFSVTDDGPGFDPSQFAIGERLAIAPEPEGVTGFGLAGAIQIIDVRGGKIWLEKSAPEKGATVSFVIDGTLSHQ